MAKFRFHKIAAIAVLIVTGAWILTGEFSSVGSARQETEPVQEAAEAEAEQPAAALRTVTVAVPPVVEHARTIHISGHTQSDKRTTLAARTSGIVAELPVTEGTQVEEGELILRLEAEGKEAAVESARQALAQREAEAAAAERLAKSGNMASLQLDAARAALASARSALELAQAELDRTVVRAPFAGVVDEVAVEKGAAVMQGAEVATLLKLDPILAVGEIGEHDIGTVRVGQEAEVRLVNDERLTGKIRYISRAASPQTRTYRIEVAVPNPEGRIPAGMTAEISLKAQEIETVALPRSVVTLNDEGQLGVRAVDDAGEVHFHPVEIVDDSPEALYLTGIPAGTRIIVAGQDLVGEGQKVKVQMAGAEAVRELASGNIPRAQ
jgi:RND family efflux transporter, MFP subunit